MAQIIGNDGGGIEIGPHGIRRIPPWEPAVRYQLRAVAALANALPLVSDREVRDQLPSLSTKLTNLLVGEVEGICGEIDAEAGLVFLDPDGGFVCGSTGKPPIPIPKPRSPLPSVGELMAANLLEPAMFQAIDLAIGKGVNPKELFEDPRGVGKRLGVELSDRSVEALRQIAPSNVESIADPVDRELVEFFLAAIEDEEHAANWAGHPLKVAEEMGVDLSDPARDRIAEVAAGQPLGLLSPGGERQIAPVVVAVVVVVIMLVPTEAGLTRLAVSDRSELDKF